MILFNVWVDGEHSKTTVIADGMNEALDIFCKRKGFIDHADYCAEHDIKESNINIEEVKNENILGKSIHSFTIQGE